MTNESANKKCQQSNVNSQMSILGIDPGIGRLGWGILTKKKGGYAAHAWGVITTVPDDDLSSRLLVVARATTQLIKKYHPDCIAVEELFFAKNVRTAIVVSHARGVVLSCAAQARLPVFEYTPLEVKQALTGYGRADKRQVQIMLKALLHVHIPPAQDDAADALAVAYTALVSQKHENMKTPARLMPSSNDPMFSKRAPLYLKKEIGKRQALAGG